MIKEHDGKIAPVEYDPSWVVKLAEEQIPEEVEVIENLKKCTTVVGFCRCGCGSPYFIDPKSKEWNFDYNEVLERKNDSDIIIDIMHDKKIGSIEFMQ
jgi:hypothetical protein